MWMDSCYMKIKKLVDRWKEYVQGKWSNQGQLGVEFDKEEDDFGMKNKEISEPTYWELGDIILKFKHKKCQE
jgi:hypothetical protein